MAALREMTTTSTSTTPNTSERKNQKLFIPFSRGGRTQQSPPVFQLPPALTPLLGHQPDGHQCPPDHLLVSGELFRAHVPLACCGSTSWYSCHLPGRPVFCINLTATEAKWPVQCALIYACMCMHIYLPYCL